MYCTSVMLIPRSRLRRGPRRLPTNDEHPTTSNKMHSDSVTSDSRELLSRTRFSQSPAIKIHEFCTRKLGPLWGAQNANPIRQTTSATSKQIRPEQNGPIPAATLYPTPAASRQSPVPKITWHLRRNLASSEISRRFHTKHLAPSRKPRRSAKEAPRILHPEPNPQPLAGTVFVEHERSEIYSANSTPFGTASLRNSLDFQACRARRCDNEGDLWNRESCFAEVFQKSKNAVPMERKTSGSRLGVTAAAEGGS
jgi:hypothetical protein